MKKNKSLKAKMQKAKSKSHENKNFVYVVQCPYCHMNTRRTLAIGVLQVRHPTAEDATASITLHYIT